MAPDLDLALAYQKQMTVDIIQIKKLEADILKRVGKPSKRKAILPKDFDRKRFELLTEHLGYSINGSIPMINVVGDSHSAFFAGCESLVFNKGRRILTGLFRPRYVSAFTELLPVFRVFHLGPATAWNASSARSSTWSYEKIQKLLKVRDIAQNSKILLVFGEIDIRYQIPKAVIKGKSINEAVTETVERFIKLPFELKERGYEPSVWLPTLIARLKPTDDSNTDSKNELPVAGPQTLRDEICSEYCKKLKEYCIQADLKSCGIDPDASLMGNESFIDGHHLSQNLMPLALMALIESDILKIPSY